MTMAVCYRCGEIKFGAFCPCPKCGALPQDEEDLALSLAMTDHYFDMPTLEQMGAAVRDGNPPHLDPETHSHLIDLIRATGMVDQLRGVYGGSEDAVEPPQPGEQVAKRPWWRFWR